MPQDYESWGQWWGRLTWAERAQAVAVVGLFVIMAGGLGLAQQVIR